MTIRWHDWDDETLAAARASGRPLFVFLFARWCRFSRECESRVLADPRVVEELERYFVCVRVDKDRRPDLDARFSAGGWPTLACLDRTLARISADAFLEPEELVARLAFARAHHAEAPLALRRLRDEPGREVERPPSHAGRASPASPARAHSPLGAEPVAWIARTLLETADPVHGGWGERHKFPHPEAIDFALSRWSETGDEAMRKLVLRTLRNMQQGEIHDRVEGGFYRFATARDWSGPHTEKTLDSNASRAQAYLQANQALGEASFAATARGALEWMMLRLYDEEKRAFRGSQDADPAYAHLATALARRERGAPAVDPTIFTGANSLAASALFKAGVVLGDEGWTRRAVSVLEFLLEELFDERLGAYHYWDGAPRLPGMLADQAQLLRALVDAAQYTGESRWLEPARTVVTLAARDLRGENGAFYDVRRESAPRHGSPRREQSIVDNATFAEALLRLSLFTRRPEDAVLAREALSAFAGDWRRHGYFVAGYARAVAMLSSPPVHVTIVAPRQDPLADRLRRAALEPYVASCVVQTLDPEDDARTLEGLALAEGWRGLGKSARAFVQRGRESYAETSDPARLPALMARIERTE